MIYLAEFSWDGKDGKRENRSGEFACLVEAANLDEATERLGALITRFQKSEQLEERIQKVFLESIVEVKRLPAEGVITRFTSESLGSEVRIRKECCLPFPGEDGCTAYSQKMQEDESGGFTPEPFMEFTEQESGRASS